MLTKHEAIFLNCPFATVSRSSKSSEFTSCYTDSCMAWQRVKIDDDNIMQSKGFCKLIDKFENKNQLRRV